MKQETERLPIGSTVFITLGSSEPRTLEGEIIGYNDNEIFFHIAQFKDSDGSIFRESLHQCDTSREQSLDGWMRISEALSGL